MVFKTYKYSIGVFDPRGLNSERLIFTFRSLVFGTADIANMANGTSHP